MLTFDYETLTEENVIDNDMFLAVYNKVCFFHTKHRKERWFEGRSDQDTSVLLIQASFVIARYIRNKVINSTLHTVDSVMLELNWSLIRKSLYTCGINIAEEIEVFINTAEPIEAPKELTASQLANLATIKNHLNGVTYEYFDGVNWVSYVDTLHVSD